MWSFVDSPCVHVGLHHVPRFPPTVKKHAGRWIRYAKLPLGVSECVWMVPCDGPLKVVPLGVNRFMIHCIYHQEGNSGLHFLAATVPYSSMSHDHRHPIYLSVNERSCIYASVCIAFLVSCYRISMFWSMLPCLVFVSVFCMFVVESFVFVFISY